MSTTVDTSVGRRQHRRRVGTAERGAWIVVAVLLGASAAFEAVTYGTATTVAVLVFLVLPDVPGLIDVHTARGLARGQMPPRAVPWYNAMHRPWAPLVVLVAYAVGPVDWPPLFAAALAWLTHIAVDRAAGYGLRGPDGFQRG